jgi:hypothetical protein
MATTAKRVTKRVCKKLAGIATDMERLRARLVTAGASLFALLAKDRAMLLVAAATVAVRILALAARGTSN